MFTATRGIMLKVEMSIEYVYYYNYYCTNFNSLNRFSVIAVKLTK